MWTEPGRMHATARAHGESWVAAWNRHDLEGILEHYADDVVFQSASVIERWGRPDGRLHGKNELREHFRRALEAAPNVAFHLQAVLAGPQGYAVLFVRDGMRVIDSVQLDAEGRAAEAHVYQEKPF
jgi:hypothetical protein